MNFNSNIGDEHELFCTLVFDNETDQCQVLMKKCGHQYSVPYNLIIEKNGEIPTCPYCSPGLHLKPKCRSTKTSYDIIRKTFEEKGFFLITPENEYKNNKQPLEYKCVCGSISKIRYNDMRRGRKCSRCKNERISKTLKHTLNTIK